VMLVGGALLYSCVDWGTDYLTHAQAQQVQGELAMLVQAAQTANDPEVIRNLKAMSIRGVFERGKMSEDGTSETRNGKFFGYSNRTILSADYFTRNRESRLTTLLHESYHAGTEDWSEDRSYGYGVRKYAALRCAHFYRPSEFENCDQTFTTQIGD
jgi:hypothetical protein